MRRLLPLTAFVAVALGGCGEDDDKPGRKVTAASGSPLPIVADEYSFDPETVVLTGGGEFELELENTGALAHNLRVFDGGSDVGGTGAFTGGKTRGAELDLEPGEYELVCTVGDHADLGMTGKLTVR